MCVELLFLPSVYAPCPTCKGARYNAKTLEIKIRDKSIADVLAMTVDGAFDFFPDDPSLRRSLGVLREVGLGYIRLGQAATELSGGEAQRIKLATELQRAQRGETLYVLDEPTTGLHPSDVAKLMTQLDGLVESGNTVIVVEHDMGVAAASDWIIDIGPGAGDEGGRIVATGSPDKVASSLTKPDCGLSCASTMKKAVRREPGLFKLPSKPELFAGSPGIACPSSGTRCRTHRGRFLSGRCLRSEQAVWDR